MKRFIGKFISSVSDINGNRISEELITKIFTEQQIVPVTIDFTGTRIGQTEKFIKVGSVVYCEFSLDETKHPFLDKAYVAPLLDNVEYHLEGRVKVIDHADLQEASVTLIPANPLSSTIKEIK